MNLKIVSDGGMYGTEVVNEATGERVDNVVGVAFAHDLDDYPKAVIKIDQARAAAAPGQPGGRRPAGDRPTTLADSPPLMILSPKMLKPEARENIAKSLKPSNLEGRRVMILEEGLEVLQLVDGRWVRADGEAPRRPSPLSRFVTKARSSAKSFLGKLRSFERRLTGY